MTNTQAATRSAGQPVTYRMILFLAGEEPNSRMARANLASLCEEDLAGRCDVEIVDVLEDYAAATEHSILVTPTLLVLEPGPAVTVVGNLSDRQRVRTALRLPRE